MDPAQVVQSYRQIYRAALRAVLFATPARHTIRLAVRTGFRGQPATAFNQRQIDNTIKFLERAADHTGLEHKIVKNLCHVRYWQTFNLSKVRNMYVHPLGTCCGVTKGS